MSLLEDVRRLLDDDVVFDPVYACIECGADAYENPNDPDGPPLPAEHRDDCRFRLYERIVAALGACRCGAADQEGEPVT